MRGSNTNILPQEVDQMVDLYATGLGIVEVGKRVNRAPNAVSAHLKRRGVIMRGQDYSSHPFGVDEDYFAQIDTPVKAYLLGLIYSDGNVYRNRFRLALQERDRQLVEDVAKELKYEGPLNVERRSGRHQNLVVLAVARKKFVAHLIDKGVIPNKTSKIGYPSFLPNSLMIPFVHGLFDGDGCVYFQKLHVGCRIDYKLRLSISGCAQLIKEISIRCSSIGIGSKVYPHSQSPASAIIHFNYSNAIKLGNAFYSARPSVFMRRKYETYFAALQMLKETGKRTQTVLNLVNNGLAVIQ